MSDRPPIFGLSTTPVTDIRSELREWIAANMLKIVYDRKGSSPAELVFILTATAVVLTAWVKAAGVLAVMFRSLWGGI